MSIEISDHPEALGAVLIHSTESGRFLPADRRETVELINAAKRGDLDAWVAGRVRSVHVWWPDPDHVQAAIDALDTLAGDARERDSFQARLHAAADYWRKVQQDIRS